MQEKARVVAIEGQVVSVVPLEIEACINCSNSECKKNGNVFKAANARGFSLSIGSQVRIKASARNLALQGALSLGVPVALAVGAYALVAATTSAGEGLRVGAALAALALGAIVSFVVAKPGLRGLPEVVEVL
ncbi:MAG TPA: SoxR reducing system RseC family protein [Treponemataceae bacterium]|nr:SoxR reducing system RseC family protein [Treponemataceae bacterium]